MTLSEVIKAIGDDQVYWQTLEESMVGNITRKKDGNTQFSFLTAHAGPEYALGNHEKICLMLWMPRKKFVSVIEEARKAQANQ